MRKEILQLRDLSVLSVAWPDVDRVQGVGWSWLVLGGEVDRDKSVGGANNVRINLII